MDFAPQLINCGTEGIFKFPEREKEALLQFAPQSASPSQSYQGMARTGLENRKSPEGTETHFMFFFRRLKRSLENRKSPEGTETSQPETVKSAVTALENRKSPEGTETNSTLSDAKFLVH